MAFDPNNNSPLTNGQTQSTTTPLNDGDQPKKEPISPWEEDLPEEAPKTQKIGTLSNFMGNNETSLKKDVSFVVPDNIEKQTALNVVEGSDYNQSDTTGGQKKAVPPANLSADVESSSRNGAMDLNLSSDKPIVQPVSTQPDATPSEDGAKVDADNYDDLDIFGDMGSPAKNISQDIKPVSTMPAPSSIPMSMPKMPPTPMPSLSMPISTAQTQTAPNPTSTQQTTFNQTPPDLQGIITPVSPNSAPPQSNQTVTAPLTSLAMPQSQVVTNALPAPKKKSFLTKLFAKFKRKKNGENLNFDQTPTLSTPGVMAQNPSLETFSKKRRLMMPLMIIGGITAIFFIGILLTESGMFSFGFEKVYNTLGIEVLWGGLPKNAEKSLGLSLFSMKNVSGFKVNGDIKLSVNKGIESEVTTPLVSQHETKKRYLAIKPEKAILAVSSDTTDPANDPATIWIDDTASNTDNSTSNSTTSDSSTSNTTSDTSTTDTSISDTTYSDQTTSDTSATDQVSDSSYQNYEPTSKDVGASIDGFFSKDGSEVNLAVDKAGTSLIGLKNSADKLWVQSDKIKFNSNAEDGKWLEYSLSALQGKNLFEGFFASDFSSVSVKGQKAGNEKVDNVRCYHYKIDSIELGEALSEVGISSDMVQSISGEIWIGIKDKMIRKINLQIVPSSNSSVSAMEISLKFSNFNAPGSFSAPDSASVITDLASFTSSISDLTTTSDQTAASSTTSSDNSVTTSDTSSTTSTTNTSDTTAASTVGLASQNDATRKSDLQSIKNSLEAYKADNGKYPVSSVVANLNVESNILAQKLISSYISALPKDPKDSEGWFYGYKSTDGKSYYLSAKLENTSDYEIKTVDNIPLYFVYNE